MWSATIRELKTAVVVALVTLLLTGVVYPVAVTAVAQVAFPRSASGSFIARGGKTVGSALIGQPFSGEGYFHSRPSAAGSGYDAAASGGSNLGPTSADLKRLVSERAARVRADEGLGPSDAVPVDLVTASGSGLDPHITPAAAYLQVARVSRERRIDEEAVRMVVERNTERAQLGVFGEPRVNVLLLNLALDELSGTAGRAAP